MLDLRDCQDPVPPPLSLDDGDPLIIHNSVSIYCKNSRVSVSHPRHRVVPHLVDPTGQVRHVSRLHRDVPRGVPGEVWPSVQT